MASIARRRLSYVHVVHHHSGDPGHSHIVIAVQTVPGTSSRTQRCTKSPSLRLADIARFNEVSLPDYVT